MNDVRRRRDSGSQSEDDFGWHWHLVTAAAVALLTLASVLIYRYDDRPSRLSESRPAGVYIVPASGAGDRAHAPEGHARRQDVSAAQHRTGAARHEPEAMPHDQ